MGKNVLEWVPNSVRWLVRPALFGSIGLHLLILFIPLSDHSALETSTSPEEMQVNLSRIPDRPSPTPKVTATPTPQASPQAVRPSPAAIRPSVQSQLQRSPVQSRPSVVQPSPQPLQPKTVPTPIPSVTPVASPDPVPPPAIPFADLPILAGTESGCFGIGTCHQIETNFRTAGQTLQAQLKAQGYTVKLREDMEETGQEVYEIAKDNETRYLNVLSSDLGTAVYLVTTQPVSLNQLQNSQTLKTELETLLDGISGVQTANAAQLAQPEAFLTGATPRPETGGKLRLVANTLPEQVLGSLKTQLQAQDFNLTEAGGYGGGRLYEVTKAAYTGYLNLVPSVDRSSTIVVLWTNLPSGS